MLTRKQMNVVLKQMFKDTTEICKLLAFATNQSPLSFQACVNQLSELKDNSNKSVSERHLERLYILTTIFRDIHGYLQTEYSRTIANAESFVEVVQTADGVKFQLVADQEEAQKRFDEARKRTMEKFGSILTDPKWDDENFQKASELASSTHRETLDKLAAEDGQQH